MKRRQFSAAVATSLLGVSGCTAEDTREYVRENYDVEEGEDFRAFTAGFDRVEWDDLDMIVHFREDHGMDLFGLLHEYDRVDSGDLLETFEAPKYGGTVRIPFVRLRDDNDREFPTPVFKLVAFQGIAERAHYLEERLGSVTVRIPDRVWGSGIIRG